MKKNSRSAPFIIVVLVLLSLIQKNSDASYAIISILMMVYVGLNYKKLKNNETASFMVIVVLMMTVRIMLSGSSRGVLGWIFWVNSFLAPFYGISMQRINLFNSRTQVRPYSQKAQIVLLAATYVALLIYNSPLVTNAHWSEGNMLWIFHGSFLAYTGTVLAMEIYNINRGFVSYIIVIALIVAPIVGALRQHLVTLVPFVLIAIVNREARRRTLFITIFIFVALLLKPELYMSNIDNYSSVLESKSGGMEDYFDFGGVVEDEGDTFQDRYSMWEEAIEATVKRNIVFGHLFSYRVRSTLSSSMAHSQFVTYFAEGGLLLLLAILVVYVKYFYYAIVVRDYSSMLVMYATIVLVSVNTWATSGGFGFLVFYIYGYYAESARKQYFASRKNRRRRL